MICCGAPFWSCRFNLLFALIISANLCVRSSSDLHTKQNLTIPPCRCTNLMHNQHETATVPTEGETNLQPTLHMQTSPGCCKPVLSKLGCCIIYNTFSSNLIREKYMQKELPGAAVHLDAWPDSRWRHWQNCQNHPSWMSKLRIEAHHPAVLVTDPSQDLISPLCCQLLIHKPSSHQQQESMFETDTV